MDKEVWDGVIVGGGIAGLSAAIYMARANRKVMVIDSGKSLAIWEPDVQNYLGFPEGISGQELLDRGVSQAEKYGAKVVHDEVASLQKCGDFLAVTAGNLNLSARRLLIATGVYHLPPQIPRVDECIGHSMFFCKDCDCVRVQGKKIAILGHNNEAVEYALGVLQFTASVFVATNGKKRAWDAQHQAWLEEYEIDVFSEKIREIAGCDGLIESLTFESGKCVVLEALFTTRGDLYHNKLAKMLEAKIDAQGQIMVDSCGRTSVAGLYAAGCVTPANCQMIVAAGQGATAAQAINRDLFEESLRDHSLKRQRQKQLKTESTDPVIL